MTKIWAIALIKDEVDIIKQNVDHLYKQGIDGMIILDNCSTDGTLELLESLNYPNLFVGSDLNKKYHQGNALKTLSEWAAIKAKTEDIWALPFDADSFIYAPDGPTIREYLLALPKEVAIVGEKVYTYYITEADDPREPDPIKRIRYREDWADDEYSKHARTKERPHQICFRYNINFFVSNGFHAIYINLFRSKKKPLRKVIPPDNFDMITKHFPIRSKKQFIKKHENWKIALKSVDERYMKTARYYCGLLKSKKLIDKIFKKDFVKQSKELRYDPVGY